MLEEHLDAIMTPSKAFTTLMEHVRQTYALSQISGLLEWDQEVMMPPDGARARAEQAAALELVIHERRTDPRIGDWLSKLEGLELDDAAMANVRLTKRNYERSVKIPAKLAEELARLTSLAQGIWAQARSENKFANFAPTLEQVIKLKREEASCLAEDGQLNYDALLNDYEPGMTVAVLQPLLENMRPRLSKLRKNIAESGVNLKALKGPFDTKLQMALAHKLGDVVGYNWNGGRLDLSTHPFSSGTGGDARITTRVDEAEPFGCLYSTIHELGHALYEQGVPKAHALTPAGQHVSMGVHESQSRILENQIGRSRAFCEWFFPHFNRAFPDCGVMSSEDLYRAANRVETGFIRTEADEVHYNLHVLLRFELERDLISGALNVGDLEAEWNARFERDFGVAVPDAAHGVLQDVHWSVGLFGYFPTYSLGNIYAGQLNQKMRSEIHDLDSDISHGKTGEVLTWMRKNIHEEGSILTPEALVEKAVGESVTADPLLDYLENKFGQIYGF
ncbi:MAG: carboxypeptidase M32 [Rhizobiaceae bacterium]